MSIKAYSKWPLLRLRPLGECQLNAAAVQAFALEPGDRVLLGRDELSKRYFIALGTEDFGHELKRYIANRGRLFFYHANAYSYLVNALGYEGGGDMLLQLTADAEAGTVWMELYVKEEQADEIPVYQDEEGLPGKLKALLHQQRQRGHRIKGYRYQGKIPEPKKESDYLGGPSSASGRHPES